MVIHTRLRMALIAAMMSTMAMASPSLAQQTYTGLSQSDADKFMSLTESGDWKYVRSALIFANSLGTPEPVRWANKRNGHKGEVLLISSEPDENGCRQFRITSNETANVKFCKDGTIEAEPSTPPDTGIVPAPPSMTVAQADSTGNVAAHATNSDSPHKVDTASTGDNGLDWFKSNWKPIIYGYAAVLVIGILFGIAHKIVVYSSWSDVYLTIVPCVIGALIVFISFFYTGNSIPMAVPVTVIALPILYAAFRTFSINPNPFAGLLALLTKLPLGIIAGAFFLMTFSPPGSYRERRTNNFVGLIAAVVLLPLFYALIWQPEPRSKKVEGNKRNGDDEETESSPPPPPPSGTMTREEAASVLGIAADAGEEKIREAYHRLIQRVHPDQGGNDFLASKINQARDVLLKTA